MMSLKKKTWKKGFVALAIVTMMAGLAGCGSKEMSASDKAWDGGYYGNSSSSDMMDFDNSYSYMEEAKTEAYAPEAEWDYVTEESVDMSAGTGNVAVEDSAGLNNVTDPTRKLITTVDYVVETEHFTDMIQSIEGKVTQLSGYVESMNTHYYYDYISGVETKLQRAYYTIRIPATDLEKFVSLVEEESNVLSRSRNVRDVTLDYVDTESRKEALQVEYDSILTLLAQADNIDTIIALESRLSDLRYEIDSLESQLRTYDNKVNYSTVILTVNEVVRYTPVITKEQTTGEKIATGFEESLQDIKEGFVDMTVSFIIALPYLGIWFVVLAIPTVIIVILVKKHKKKKCNHEMHTEEGHGGQL